MKWVEPLYANEQRLIADDGEIFAVIKYQWGGGWSFRMKRYISAEAARAAAEKDVGAKP